MLEHEYKYVSYRLDHKGIYADHYPPRRIITWNSLTMNFARYKITKSFSIYYRFSSGLAIANYIKPTKKGDVAFGEITKKVFTSSAGMGMEIKITNSLRIQLFSDLSIKDIWSEIPEVSSYDIVQNSIKVSFCPAYEK